MSAHVVAEDNTSCCRGCTALMPRPRWSPRTAVLLRRLGGLLPALCFCDACAPVLLDEWPQWPSFGLWGEPIVGFAPRLYLDRLWRATCLHGSWGVRYRGRWCPVVLTGFPLPWGIGDQISQVLCLRMASRMQRAALRCHYQCS